MGRYIVNVLFGFAAAFLFLSAFGCMLGLVTVGGAITFLYLLLDYCLQQGWLLVIKMTGIAYLTKTILISSTKQAFSYIYNKISPFFKKKKETVLIKYAT